MRLLRKPIISTTTTIISSIGFYNYFNNKNNNVIKCDNYNVDNSVNGNGIRMRDQMIDYVKNLQISIVNGIKQVDDSNQSFKIDKWTRPQGGEGISCVLQNGNVIEKAGVGVSIVHGNLPPAGIKQMRANHAGIPYDPNSDESLPFSAVGLSLIIHPRNPMCPTVHANYRYFELYDSNSDPSKTSTQPIFSWFGGGSDLTPIYLIEEDATHFHNTIKYACDKHDPTFYPRFKAWADKYFYIPHRQECRGVGGIFFDDLTPGSQLACHKSSNEIFNFIKECGDSFLNSYIPIIEKRKDLPYTDNHKRWQELRRGRYVEFNLVHDRGTKFGLNAGGARIESILMSLPLTAKWEYMSDMGTLDNTEENKLLSVLKIPVDWHTI